LYGEIHYFNFFKGKTKFWQKLAPIDDFVNFNNFQRKY